jgi:peptidoglycan/LPS O-acetylase OafA/YrhL
LQYRSEIDGLRAVAILPVMLFHAGFGLFQGGYVGVDVFFVISGFLITQTIAEEMARGRFTLTGFYERRARRILPALFVVLAASAPLAYLLSNPLEFRDYSASLLGVITFSINVLAAIYINYFGPSADYTPLLHIWSLAVEEQFYLFFPLLLMAFHRIGRGRLSVLLLVAGLASLGFAEWKAMQATEGLFYWSSARAWELLIGALAALNPMRRLPPLAENAFSGLGLGLIAFAVLRFDDATPLPGLWSLLPTLGAVLVICFAHSGTLAHRLLSAKVAVFIGLISYSAYLWHQPVLVFARLGFGPLTTPLAAAALVLSLLLAWLSWRYVEAPFRQRGPQARISRARLAAIFGPATVLAFAFGALGFVTDGFYDYYTKNRLSKAELAIFHLITGDTNYDPDAAMVDNGDCRFWQNEFTPAFQARFADCAVKYGPGVLLIGDSHAMNMHNILAKSGMFPFVASVAWHGCRPVPAKEACQYEEASAFVDGQAKDIAALLFHQSGSYLIEDGAGRVDSDGSFADHARNRLRQDDVDGLLRYLAGLAGQVKTLWIGPYVEARVSLKYLGGLTPQFRLNPNAIPLFEGLDAELSHMTAEQAPQVGYVSMVQAFAIAPDFLRVGDCITYRDADHFSRCGEDLLAQRLAADRAAWQKAIAP